VQFYCLLASHSVWAGIPIPLSLFISVTLRLILAACLRRHRLTECSWNLIPTLSVCLACAVIFPIAQMLCFGKTDYRRPADAVVVLGARVYADGRPSDALADRVRTACQLYREGLARKLILSGGPGDGAVHETESMRRMALQLGVKADDIWLDEAGLNTQSTVRNTEAVFSRWQASRILVVSHFYHLPRIKLAYQRDGWDVYTVPAKESYVLRQMPYNMAREVAALWVYYLRPLAKA
jgi:vancomycin permeability regulator SanA